LLDNKSLFRSLPSPQEVWAWSFSARCIRLVIEINFEVGGIAAVWNSIFVDLRLCYVRSSIMVYNTTL
jgi:hypothetical protein